MNNYSKEKNKNELSQKEGKYLWNESCSLMTSIAKIVFKKLQNMIYFPMN